MEWGCTLPEKVSSIQVFHLSGVLLDKLFARLYLVAHQRGEQLIRHRRRLDRDLEHRPVLRVHRRLPELLRVHLRETLEAGDTGVSVGPDTIHRLSQLGVVFGVVLTAIVRDLVERRKSDVDVAGAYRAYQGLYFGVGEDLVDVGFLYVEDLAA